MVCNLFLFVNPIQQGLLNYVVTWRVFLTHSSFQLCNSVKSDANIPNLFPDKIFDIQTSFGTTISTFKEVWLSISVRQSQSLSVCQDFKNWKNNKGFPRWKEKIVSDFTQLFFVRPLPLGFQMMLKDPKKFCQFFR